MSAGVRSEYSSMISTAKLGMKLPGQLVGFTDKTTNNASLSDYNSRRITAVNKGEPPLSPRPFPTALIVNYLQRSRY